MEFFYSVLLSDSYEQSLGWSLR